VDIDQISKSAPMRETCLRIDIAKSRLTEALCVVVLFLVTAPVLTGTVDRMRNVLLGVPFEDWINARYYDNPFITALHLVPGFIMLTIAPVQFVSRIRSKYPFIHKALGWVFCLTGVICSLGLLWMVVVFPALGGLMTQVVSFILVAALMIFLFLAIRAARRRSFQQHRAFMMRSYAIALSVSTARIFIEVSDFFFQMPFELTFVPASAAGVIVNLVAVEWIVRRG
jgi:uncharacterized membrane protein